MKIFFITRFRREILGLVFLFMTGAVFGQVSVTGTVTDESGTTLPGVTVVVSGTTNGTITDVNGKYALQVENTNVSLEFSFVGYQKQTISLNGKSVLNVEMKEEKKQIDEVVIVGYSAQKKATLTGAVAPVNIADVDKRKVGDLAQALQGQVAGVQVTSSTGAPGDAVNIRIRGEGTIGNNNPLYVIDGVPSRDISFLNPSDIKSMTVLKDASAAAIYGARAAGGVIVITTKEGIKGKSTLDVSYYTGIQKVANLPHMLNAQQYMNVVEEAWNNAGYSGTNPYTADKGRSDFANTNWLDALFELGHSQNAQVTATGGNNKVQYLLSANYYGNDGIVVYNNDKYQRINFRSNISANLTERLKVGSNLLLSYVIQDALSSKGDEPGIIRHAMIRPPIIPIYKDPSDPTWSAQDPFTDLPFYKNKDSFESNKYEWSQNPIALAYFTDDVRSYYKTFGNLYAEYAFLGDKSLKFKTNLGVDLTFSHNKAFHQNFGDDDGSGSSLDQGLGRQNRPSTLNEDRGEEITFTWDNTLNYVKDLGKSSINALVGSEFITNHSSSISGSRARYDYTGKNFRYLDFGGTQYDVWNGGSAAEWALFSLFGSATYSYDSKYMVTANFRADASSRFAQNNRWGYFPSISAGWKLSNEDFMKDLTWLSDLKLRASVGQLGNQEIDNYAYLTLLRKSGDSYLISRYGNPDLKWETTTQYNYGLDLGLLSNKIYFTADYFIKNTTDILLPISLPSIAGDVSPTYVNAGAVTNKGFEFALTLRNSEHQFKYNVNLNLATLKNEVTKLHPNLPMIINAASKGVARTVVGQPLNSYYGYVMEGIYQNTQEIQQQLYGTANPTAQPGDIRFKDLNGDGVINDKDRTFIGNSIPKLTYGMNLTGEYKGFDLSLLFQGVHGVDRYNDGKKIVDYDTRPFNYTTRVLSAWHGEGTSNTIPRVSFTDNGSSKISSVFVEDASYFRLKNVELGYTFKQLMQRSKTFKNLRAYVSAQNVFTVTKYTGLDPESTDLIDMGTYPQSRAFILGVDVKF